MKSFEYLKGFTSDIGFIAYGKTMEELFEHAAEALFSVISSGVKPKREIRLEVKGEHYEDLMFNWLQELIALVDTDDIFLSEFEIEKLSESKLVALCRGEDANPEKGHLVVKAVTNHLFNLEQGKINKVTVTLDI